MEPSIILIILAITYLLFQFFTNKTKPRKMVSKEILTKVQSLISTSHIFVASKSYCPYCQATLATFKTLGVSPNIMQLNQVEDGEEIQDALWEITGQRTVPNIFIDGKHIGGNSDLQALKSSGELATLLKL